MAVTSALVDSTVRTGSTGTTSTITGAQFGTAFAGRVLVVPIQTNSANPPSAVSIGGVSAVITGTGTAFAYLASAVVPTGTSGNIVFTFPSSDAGISIGVVALTGAASATPSATLDVANPSGSINVPAGGAVIAQASASATASWTGASALLTDSTLFPGFVESVAAFSNSGSAITGHALSYGSVSTTTLVAAAFTAGGGGTTVNLTGVAATGSAGTLGKKVDESEALTGVHATASAGAITTTAVSVASLTGVAAAGHVGSLTETASGSAAITGVSGTGHVGTLTGSASASFALTGVSATGSAGAIFASIAFMSSGVQATGSAGTIGRDIDKGITGVSASGTAGDIPAQPSGVMLGVSATGVVSGAIVPNVSVLLTGVQASGHAGNISTGSSRFSNLDGVAGTGFAGTILGSVSGAFIGVQATTAAGFIASKIDKGLTGVSATGEAGTISAEGPGSGNLIGVQAVGGVGSPTQSVSVVVPGVLATGSAGAIGRAVDHGITGVAASGQVGLLGSASNSVSVLLVGVQAVGQVGIITFPAPSPFASPGASGSRIDEPKKRKRLRKTLPPQAPKASPSKPAIELPPASLRSETPSQDTAPPEPTLRGDIARSPLLGALAPHDEPKDDHDYEAEALALLHQENAVRDAIRSMLTDILQSILDETENVT